MKFGCKSLSPSIEATNADLNFLSRIHIIRNPFNIRHTDNIYIIFLLIHQ